MIQLLPAIAVLVIGSYDPRNPQPTSPAQPQSGIMVPVTKPGTLDRQTVRYYIRLQQPAVRHCYVLELGRQPNLKTRVTLDLSIDATGRVTKCGIGSTPLDHCVARAVCTIRFPYVYDTLQNGQTQVSLSSTQVRYSFRFQPRKRKGKSQPLPPAIGRGTPAQPEVEPPKNATQRPRVSQPNPMLKPQPGPAPASRPASHPKVPRIKVPKGKDPLEGLDLLNPL